MCENVLLKVRTESGCPVAHMLVHLLIYQFTRACDIPARSSDLS